MIAGDRSAPVHGEAAAGNIHTAAFGGLIARDPAGIHNEGAAVNINTAAVFVVVTAGDQTAADGNFIIRDTVGIGIGWRRVTVLNRQDSP